MNASNTLVTLFGYAKAQYLASEDQFGQRIIYRFVANDLGASSNVKVCDPSNPVEWIRL
jgi:hypothetical protein